MFATMKFIREYAKRMPGMERVDEIKKGSISFQNASFIPSAPRVGLEPTTLRLTVACSTIELPRNILTTVLLLIGDQYNSVFFKYKPPLVFFV